MSDEERRTIVVTSAILLAASFLRLAWEIRPVPPILPPNEVPAALIEETREAVRREERMQTPLAPGERVDANRDSDVELARLPGIGPTLASRIVSHREQEGPFERPADLLEVNGIGPATLERIEPLMSFSATSTMGRSRPSRPGGSPRVSLQEGGPIALVLDLNRASASELETLPGVGPVLASRIVEQRSRIGRFSRLEELTEVTGIGAATLERLRPNVRITR